MMEKDVFEPVQLGDLTLANRMVMAPMTRNRADAQGVVTPMMVTYYRQRASAGLIITESVPVSPEAIGYPLTPGIYTEQQVAGWVRLTDAVHAAGGKIFVQLQHCGRISHPSLQPDNATPVAPTPLRPEGQVYTYTGKHDYVTPRELEISEIPKLVAQFKHAAEMARHAGFDGVEVHGANGYIIDQFLRDGSNRRTDAYGGSVQNRMRLLNEVLDAVGTVWPAQRIGVRLTPENRFNSMSDSNPQTHFSYFVEQLSPRGLAYLHVLEGDMTIKDSEVDYRALRSKYSGSYIANNGYDLARAQTAVRSGNADLVAFGTPFLANPDLVRRYREGLPLNEADRTTFYQGGEAGYIDYSFYSGEQA
ncbi:N-ethylmaleimide reductase [Cohnella sp. OV330]|nr:N-ethylmaleimide reductase [Cohnella sp. OV330]